MTNLTQAHKQWAERPADERFWTIDEMHQATLQSCQESVEVSTTLEGCEFHGGRETIGIYLPNITSSPMEMSHYAFGQVCRTFGAPAEYLRSLPASTAISCLQVGHDRWMDNRGSDATRQFLVHQTDERSMIRAVTSERYSRVWNHEIVARLGQLHAEGWRVPSARPSGHVTARDRVAGPDDVIDYGKESALTVKVGDVISPAGLYASDHDMFAFMIHPDIVIEDGESPGGLRRGTMIRQSEVGDCSIWKLDFLFNTVCGNHIVWGAQNVKETRVRHTGSGVGEKWQAMVQSIEDFSQSSAREQESKIAKAKEIILGNNKEEIIDYLFSKRAPLSKRESGHAIDIAEMYEDVHGNPRSLWGFVQGVTRLSQQTAFTDKRNRLDMAAGKILAEVISLN